MADLFPPIEPYESGMLAVGERHRVYWEQCGKPDGQPVVFLHGGPGSGCQAEQRRFFDPGHYRIVLFDQRGSGRSTPLADVTDNTTPHLVNDIEALRSPEAVTGYREYREPKMEAAYDKAEHILARYPARASAAHVPQA